MRETEEGVILEIKVIPGSKERKIEVKRGEIIVRIRERPKRGRANSELIKFLEDLFLTKVSILSGISSRRKRILIRGARVEEVEKRLKGLGKTRIFL